MMSAQFKDILRGRCQEIPNVRSKIVRIFLSSTFTDSLCERDSMIESVFPKLKDYCREKYGLEFQYSDMRWGIEMESFDNHSEVQTCLNEIELCKKYSVATNFLVLLSHRYGSRPTPATIRASLFERLLEMIRADPARTADAELLAQWYQLDSNCIPAAYVLRTISSMLPDIKSSNTNEMKQANREWQATNDRIRTCLRQAAADCLEHGHIQESEYDDFFISVTEKEIVNGILSVPNANERTLCFIREIEGIRNCISDSKASKFIDLKYTSDEQPVIDEEAEGLLNRLKYTRIPSVLKPSNIHTYNVPWTHNGINRQDHSDYISTFNDDVYNAIKQQIDECAKSRISVVSDPLQHEILEHAIQCKTYVAKFHGRTDVLDKLGAYVRAGKEQRPCVVYGASGCGKTSVLAKAAIEAFNWWSDRSVSVILRFLGTTPTSSTIYKTMLSLSQQISRLYNLPMQLYPDVGQLRYQLESHLLLNIPDDEYLVILLDSIDQLDQDGYDCQWLPAIFPKNVKCIVSTLPDHGNILANLKILINCNPISPKETEHLLVFVPPFEASTVDVVYSDWLVMKQRSLSDEQRSFIRQLMSNLTEILPLFMKLIFDIIVNWHSYDPIDTKLSKLRSVDDCIAYLFNHLQTVHNRTLFRRAICYMTACRNGISQNELEDVLSLDDDVLQSVFQHYIPPVRRIPGILWTRIRNDLDEYITEKEADDSSVIYWYHRRFIEVARSMYISKMDANERKVVFQNMVDLYKETWKGKNKPFKIQDEKLIKKYNLVETQGEVQANRLTTSQPIEFVDASGCVQFNKRKLNELPQFLSQLAPDLSIPIAAEEIFFNYAFMRAKVACSPFNDILSDFQAFKNSSTYRISQEAKETKAEMNILSLLYLITGALLQEYPENYPFEISARLLNLYGIKPYITKLIKQIDEQSIRYCSLIAPYCQIQPPGSGLIFSVTRHTTSVVDFDFTDDQRVAISLSDRIVVVDMQEASTVLDIDLPTLNEPYLNSTTIPNVSYFDVNDDTKTTTTDSDDKDRFKKYLFLVNSLHHVYLVSAHESIKFERSSQAGYSCVEVIDKRRGLCIVAEINGNCVECWDVVKNRLFQRITFASSTIKHVLCVSAYSMVITILQDGTIHFHSVTDWNKSSFAHRGTIQAGIHLNLASVDGNKLICTFDGSVPIDLAIINLSKFEKSEQVFSDQDIVKVLLTFDPPIKPKPIQSIIIPQKETMNSKKASEFPLFSAKTSTGVYIIHKCIKSHISYSYIHGQFDVVTMHACHANTIYTARGGILEIYRWSCVEGEDNAKGKCQMLHKYQLYVSIDISSSPVTTISPSSENALLFLCSLANGVIQAYFGNQARKALKRFPSFPRTNEVIRETQLFERLAVTLDDSRSELTTWTYQYATSIESNRVFRDGITIKEFAITSNKADPDTSFVLILTVNRWIEIYQTKSLKNDPIFTLQLRSPARIYSSQSGAFFVLTNKGLVYVIGQKDTSDGQIQFDEKATTQLKFQCSKMLGTVVTLHGSETIIVFSDDGQSLAVWTVERLIHINVPLPQCVVASTLISINSDRTENLGLLYFSDKTLISCQVNIEQSKDQGSIRLAPFDKADKFCIKHDCLATYNDGNTELNIHNIRLYTCYEPIQLENQCLQLCLNESAHYLFVLVKPRILFMYRIHDRRRLAKLFVYDFVSSMVADKNFIVLAMNDRRLLTLMIADPDDPYTKTQIGALPSRNPRQLTKSAIANLVEHMEKCAEMSSSENSSAASDDDIPNDENNNATNPDNKYAPFKIPRPASCIRFVTRLHIRHSPSKMRSDDELNSKAWTFLSDPLVSTDVSTVIDDSNDESHDDDQDVKYSDLNSKTAAERSSVDYDLNSIRQKALEHNQQQLKGFQLANAGDGNLKIVNSGIVTSTTCTLS